MEGGRSDLRATSRDILRLIHSHVEQCRACSELRGLGQRNTRSTGDGMLSTLLARRMRTGMCGAANGSTDSTFRRSMLGVRQRGKRHRESSYIPISVIGSARSIHVLHRAAAHGARQTHGMTAVESCRAPPLLRSMAHPQRLHMIHT